MDIDTYKTIEVASPETLFKEKNSKFFGYAFPITSENDVKTHISDLKKQHHSARHWCYAYQIGVETITFRANDDGEPSHSAGTPIYGQIQSFNVTNILIVVVRYFGGVKLGIGGLIQAYKTSAQLTLNTAEIKEKTINKLYSITFDYKNMNKVMRIIKEKKLNITNQILEIRCDINISVRKKDAQHIYDIFNHLYDIDIKDI